jgi:hypothetical protein
VTNQLVAPDAFEDYGVRRVLAALVRADLSAQFEEFFDCEARSPHTRAVTSEAVGGHRSAQNYSMAANEPR